MVVDDRGIAVYDLRARLAPIAAAPSLEAPLATLPRALPESAVDEPDDDAEPIAERLPPPAPDRGEIAALPDGLALLGRAGAAPAGFRSTGEIVSRVAWSHPMPLAVPGPVDGIAGAGGSLLVVSSDEVFAVDPENGAARVVAAMPATRAYFACVVVGGLLLLVGGRGGAGHDGGVLALDLADGRWSDRRPMPVRLERFAAVAAADGVHCVGGIRRVFGLAVAGRAHLVYDALTDEWADGPPLLRPMVGPVAVDADGVHVVGGRGRWLLGRRLLRSHLVFDAGAWHRAEPLHERARGSSTGARYGEGPVVAGDATGRASTRTALHRFDARRDAWFDVSTPRTRLVDVRLAAADERLVLVGREPGGGWTMRTLAVPQHFDVLEPVRREDAP